MISDHSRVQPVQAHSPSAVGAAMHPGARASKRVLSVQRSWHKQFLPTLFDRLCDDAPSERKEVTSDHAPTRGAMRRIVRRDLAFLLNASNQDDLLRSDGHGAVISSTVNYGVPASAGGHLSERRLFAFQKAIRRAILDFEPRLLAESLSVKPLVKQIGEGHYNVLVFEIHGLLHMEPYPVEFSAQSSVDLETHQVSLNEL